MTIELTHANDYAGPERRKVPRGTVKPTGRFVVYDVATTIIPRKPSRRDYWQDAIYASKGAANGCRH